MDSFITDVADMDLIVDIVCVFFITLLFFLINKLVKETSESFGKEETDWLWRNTAVSLIHASISGFWSLFYLGIPTLELFDPGNSGTRWLTRFCCGYSAYDFFDYLWQPKRKNDISTVGILVHHVITVATLFLGLNYDITSYTCRGLSVEVNSFFLHTRRLFKLKKVSPESTTYQLNNIFLFATCIFFRFGLAIHVSWVITMGGSRKVPLWCVVWFNIAVAFFFILSIYMIERIYHSDYRRRKQPLNNNLVNGHKESVLTK